MPRLRWDADAVRTDGIYEQNFSVERQGQQIPGIVWRPAASHQQRPLVLMGHGGSGHKRSAKMLHMGRLFAVTYGWWAAAIDGPVHGARGSVTDATDPAYRQMWQRQDVVQEMIADWRATLDALSELREIDSARVGYWGVSMGTMFGLPYVTSDRRIRAAVLGKAGMRGSSVVRSGIDTHFERHAPLLSIPVLFAMQWDDERFDRDGQLELFDRLGSPDKRLHAYPGKHSDDGPEALEVGAQFLARHLN
jgi:dienelactone hydrolase